MAIKEFPTNEVLGHQSEHWGIERIVLDCFSNHLSSDSGAQQVSINFVDRLGQFISYERRAELKFEEVEAIVIEDDGIGFPNKATYMTYSDKDENLQAIKNTLSKTESELDNLQTEVGKVPGVTNILSLMSETASKQPPQCYSESDKQKIDSELKSFGDKTWQDLWRVFIDNTTSSNCSYTPDLLYKTLDYGYNKIVEATE